MPMLLLILGQDERQSDTYSGETNQAIAPSRHMVVI